MYLKLGKLFTIIPLTLFIYGCGSTGGATGIAYSTAPKPAIDNTKSTVYVYRTDEQSGYASTKILYVNNKKLVDLGSGGYTWYQIKPGQHEIKMGVPWLKRDLHSKYNPSKLSINTEAGKTYYVHFNIGVKVEGTKRGVDIVSGIAVPTFTPDVSYSESLSEVEEKLAIKTLKNYIYQTSKK